MAKMAQLPEKSGNGLSELHKLRTTLSELEIWVIEPLEAIGWLLETSDLDGLSHITPAIGRTLLLLSKEAERLIKGK